VLALVAGALIMFKVSFPPKFEPRSHEVGIATTNILVDTPNSQVVDVSPKGSDTLGVRANLLASLMVDGVVKQSIAQAAGLNPNDIAGKSASTTGQTANPPASRNAPVLSTQVITNTSSDAVVLPIIQVNAQAKDAATAARLAAASITGLRNYLNTKAASEDIPDAQRLQVTGLGAPVVTTAQRGPGGVLAFVAVILVFVLGCAGILAVLALVRGWRDAEAREGPNEAQRGVLAPVYPNGPGAATPHYGELPFGGEELRDGDTADGWSTDWLVPDSPSLMAVTPGREQESDDKPDRPNE
jgi:hypothetical protein